MTTKNNEFLHTTFAPFLEKCKKLLIGKVIGYWNKTPEASSKGTISDLAIRTDSERGTYLSMDLEGEEVSIHCFVSIAKPADLISNRVELKNGKIIYLCSMPIIEGYIPIDKLFNNHFTIEERDLSISIKNLIRKTGTFTQCPELMKRLSDKKFIWKDSDDILHVDFNFCGGCMCMFAYLIEDYIAATKDLKKFFDAEKIVYYYDPQKLGKHILFPKVSPHDSGRIENIMPNHEGELCFTYPIVKGLGMRWAPLVSPSEK